MTESGKKVLFVSDFSPNSNGFGGAQTAYNLIQRINAEKFIYVNDLYFREIVPESIWKRNKDFSVFNYTLSIYTTNRLEKFLARLRAVVNMEFFWVGSSMKRHLLSFNPASAVFITNTPYIFTMAIKLKKIIPQTNFYFYIMDDYRFYDSHRYKRKMDQAFHLVDGWFSISESMKKQFTLQFPILNEKPCFVFQNPVSEKLLVKKRHVPTFEKLRFAYAGSVYSNHLDGLLLFIKTIRALPQANVSLDIFTKPEFRDRFQEFENDRVVYKGVVEYSDLHERLSAYDFGLVTESFQEEIGNMSKHSVQTKIKDYILSGCLPVVIGPADGACRAYIDSNNLGYCYSGQHSTDECTSFVKSLFGKKSDYEQRINYGQSFVREGSIQLTKELHRFLLGGLATRENEAKKI